MSFRPSATFSSKGARFNTSQRSLTTPTRCGNLLLLSCRRKRNGHSICIFCRILCRRNHISLWWKLCIIIGCSPRGSGHQGRPRSCAAGLSRHQLSLCTWWYPIPQQYHAPPRRELQSVAGRFPRGPLHAAHSRCLIPRTSPLSAHARRCSSHAVIPMCQILGDGKDASTKRFLNVSTSRWHQGGVKITFVTSMTRPSAASLRRAFVSPDEFLVSREWVACNIGLVAASMNSFASDTRDPTAIWLSCLLVLQELDDQALGIPCDSTAPTT